jgi:hypothetical protein
VSCPASVGLLLETSTYSPEPKHLEVGKLPDAGSVQIHGTRWSTSAATSAAVPPVAWLAHAATVARRPNRYGPVVPSLFAVASGSSTNTQRLTSGINGRAADGNGASLVGQRKRPIRPADERRRPDPWHRHPQIDPVSERPRDPPGVPLWGARRAATAAVLAYAALNQGRTKVVRHDVVQSVNTALEPRGARSASQPEGAVLRQVSLRLTMPAE